MNGAQFSRSRPEPTNAQREGSVQVLEWLEAFNSDFRYQLTAIGAPGPNLYIGQEIEGNRYQIAGGKPGLKVSWQVTGIRHDPFAEANRIKVEEDKPEKERGFYAHPEVYGQPKEKSLEYADRPPERPTDEKDRRGETARTSLSQRK